MMIAPFRPHNHTLRSAVAHLRRGWRMRLQPSGIAASNRRSNGCSSFK
jgi:hypothetical protein